MPDAARSQPIADAQPNPEVHDAVQEQPSTDGRPIAPNHCTDLIQVGSPICEDNRAGPPPNLGLGGALVDGVYDLIQFILYVRPPGQPYCPDREIIRISGSGTLLEYMSDGVPTGMVLSIAPEGASLNDRQICPPGDFNMFIGPYYTATGDQFIAQNSSIAKVFKKRP